MGYSFKTGNIRINRFTFPYLGGSNNWLSLIDERLRDPFFCMVAMVMGNEKYVALLN